MSVKFVAGVILVPLALLGVAAVASNLGGGDAGKPASTDADRVPGQSKPCRSIDELTEIGLGFTERQSYRAMYCK